jgi:phosphotransacetylase
MVTKEASDIGTVTAIGPVGDRPHANYERLVARARQIPAAITVVVHPCDETSLRGAVEAAEAGIIIPILVGPAAKVSAVAREHNIDIARFEIVDVLHSEAAAAKGVEPGTPRVAILSAVEIVTPKIPSTIDAAALCKMAERGQITGGILDGPLAFDNAIDPEAAKIKGIKSDVAGRAQILVVPDLEAGNMLAKNLTFLARADAAGLVLGARVPIILTSRADSVRARMASCAAAVLYAHARRSTAALPKA